MFLLTWGRRSYEKKEKSVQILVTIFLQLSVKEHTPPLPASIFTDELSYVENQAETDCKEVKAHPSVLQSNVSGRKSNSEMSSYNRLLQVLEVLLACKLNLTLLVTISVE